MSDTGPLQPFFLIIADEDHGVFCVEGPMSDDAPWHAAARQALNLRQRHITCGPSGPDRDGLAATYRSTHRAAGVPPGSIVRPRQ
jgi:hypothetical protein